MYPSFLRRIDDLDEAFEDDFPDVPSLMPGPCDIAMTKAALPKELAPPPPPEVPDLVFDAPPVRKEPMFRTSSSANVAAVRAPAPGPQAPELDFDSTPPAPSPALALDFPAHRPAPAPIAESGGFDSLEEDHVDLKLDIKETPKRLAGFETMSGVQMSPASDPASPVAPAASARKSHDPRPGIFAFAGFGIPPESLGGMPAYALRVIARKWTLRDDLRVARLRRIQDVSLYEAALESADEAAVTKGLALIAATVIGGVSAVVTTAAFLL